jgi:hypothetical protein
MRDGSKIDVTVYDIIVKPEPSHAPQKSMSFFIEKIKALQLEAKTENWNSKKTIKTYIRDLEIDPQGHWAVLLLYFADGNAPGASFTNLDDNRQEDYGLKERQGRPESVHLLISLAPQKTEPIRYLGVLEDSNKLTRLHVQSYINFLIRSIGKEARETEFKIETEDGARNRDGSPKTYYFKNKFEFQGHPAQDFINMIEQGKLMGISLETARIKQSGFGEKSFVKPRKEELFLTPTSGKWFENPINRLNEALSFGKHHKYEAARIVFQTDDGKSHTARVDTETQNIIGDRLVRRHRLEGFTNVLKEADDQINGEIKEKIIEIFHTSFR